MPKPIKTLLRTRGLTYTRLTQHSKRAARKSSAALEPRFWRTAGDSRNRWTPVLTPSTTHGRCCVVWGARRAAALTPPPSSTSGIRTVPPTPTATASYGAGARPPPRSSATRPVTAPGGLCCRATASRRSSRTARRSSRCTSLRPPSAPPWSTSTSAWQPPSSATAQAIPTANSIPRGASEGILIQISPF